MNESSAKTAQAEKPKHPLADLIPTSFQSFGEWLARWNSATVLGEKLGLLHCVQTMEYWPGERKEAVFFLLDVANGHRTGEPFRRWHGEWGAQEINKARETISRKAFDVLCVKLFAPGKENYPPLWLWMVEEQETFDKLLWFCHRDNQNYQRPYDGCEADHHMRVFGNFLEEFSRLGWTLESYLRFECWRVDVSDVRTRLVAARPQFIEILNYLRQLYWLNRPMGDFGSDFPELDQACLKKLKEMAFRRELPLPPEDYNAREGNKRIPKTLNEAIRGGSVAAEILVLHDIRQREDKRIRALHEQSLGAHREAERLQTLARINKAKRDLEAQAAQLGG